VKPSSTAERTARRAGSHEEEDADAGAPRIVRVDPSDGATGVFRDVPVVVRLSHRADEATLSGETLRVEDENGPVPGRQWVSPDGRLVMWSSDRLLSPGMRHRVTATGIRDVKGRELLPHASGFIPCDLVWNDVSG